MINIISKSYIDKEIRGPKKVVDNLITGLQKINYPYVINKKLDATDRLWIHDDIAALREINKLPQRVRTIIGPNLFISPDQIPKDIDISKTIYIQPSLNVVDIWNKQGFNRTKLEIWPAGVDIEKFRPSPASKEYVLLYFKNRSTDDLKEVESTLKEKNIAYRLIKYGHYKEKDYLETLQKTKYIIWLGGSESQGLALEEAMAMNVPILVADEGKDFLGIDITAAPYFSSECGIKIKSLDMLNEKIEEMEKSWMNFNARKFVTENLSLEKQAKDLLMIYANYFGLSYEQGFSEKIQSNEDWRNNKFYFKLLLKSKGYLKKIVNGL